MIESTPLRASSPTLFYYLPACLRSIYLSFFCFSLPLFFTFSFSFFFSSPLPQGVLGTAKAESRPGTSSPRRTGQLTADSATLALLAAERKRREQLERRTGDMMREVQQLRQELRLAQAQ